MGESRKPHLRVDFDRRRKLEFHRSKITSDAGFLTNRELDEVLGLNNLGGAALSADSELKCDAPGHPGRVGFDLADPWKTETEA